MAREEAIRAMVAMVVCWFLGFGLVEWREESENLEGKVTSHKILVVFTESQKTPSYFVRRLPVE